MLFVTAVDMECPEYTEELSRQFWMRVWSRVRIHSRIDSKANLSVLDKGFEKCFFFLHVRFG